MAYMPLDKSKLYLDDSKMPKIYDLSHPFGVDTPVWPGVGRSDVAILRNTFLSASHKRSCIYTGSMHTGTHMDAPVHTLHEDEVDRARNGYFLDEVRLGRCIGTGVIIDMRYLQKEFEEKWNAAGGDLYKLGDIWHMITPEEVQAALDKDGLEIRENDWVVINTGWQCYWRINNDKYYNYYAGMGPELAKWLIFEKHIKGISGTWGATDAPLWHYPLKDWEPWLDDAYRKATGKDPDVTYPDYEPCHRLFAQHGVVTVENGGGDIDQCTGKRMIIAAFPIRCEIADGGWVRLVAWEEGTF